MTSRRSFIKTMAVGTAALSSAPALNALETFIPMQPQAAGGMKPVFKGWTSHFDGKSSVLSLPMGYASLPCILS